MNDVKIEWYKFVDTYDQFHRHGFHSGYNFMFTVKSEIARQAIESLTSEIPSFKVYSDSAKKRNPNDDWTYPRTLHATVQDEIEAMTVKLKL
jgi:hypothetical protein